MPTCENLEAHVRVAAGALVFAALVGCAHPLAGPQPEAEREVALETPATRLHVLNRVSWGANPSSARRIEALGTKRYIEEQLRAAPTALPAEVQAQIDAMTISTKPLDAILFDVEQQRRAAVAIKDPDQQLAARRAYQQELNRLAREAATRSLLRAVHSPNQLHEQMTWFWMNHFNVFQLKANVRAMVGDFEENAIRPHALGRFRALLGATAKHPAMLRYLDNVQNAANAVNENYARELMELHTLGVSAGYTQRDVQELARVLTGVGIALTPNPPPIRIDRQIHYVRTGAFQFNPNRHDYGEKIFLGERVKSAGPGELEEVLDRLARHPATARFISRKLAVYFVSDNPGEALVESVARTFESTDGDIAATLRAILGSTEFAGSQGQKFKDPVHYVVSALRLAYDGRPLLNMSPAIAWLNRMGQGLYNRQTPDGYPLTQAAWSSPGQMATRFEVARAMGSAAAEFFGGGGEDRGGRADARPLSDVVHRAALQNTLAQRTLDALEQARSAAEWNIYFLSSPEFMQR